MTRSEDTPASTEAATSAKETATKEKSAKAKNSTVQSSRPKSLDEISEEETRELVALFTQRMAEIREQVGKAVVGQQEVVEHLLVTLLVGGHCLITGMPGTAKTLLVRTMAEALGLSFKRIQFTPDLMPTDITGTDIVDEGPDGRQWKFVPGPLFANVVLADEINRTPPKTQAALLEAMQEQTVTVRGNNHQLDKPFFVLATQNPIELEGTYPLPEAQLDRFLFNVMLDYLSADDELGVVNRYTNRVDLPKIEACTNQEEILKFQWLVRQVPVSEEVNRHAVDLVRATRPDDELASSMVKKYVKFGASVRATMFLTLAAKARALLEGRYHVTTDDLKSQALPVLRHRVLANYFAESDGVSVDDILNDMINTRLAN
jgi:MoxR-like ATPase